MVLLKEEDKIFDINLEHLEPVTPDCLDFVKVVLGEDRDAVGQLLALDCREGVVKLMSGEIKLIQLQHLCRMKTRY